MGYLRTFVRPPARGALAAGLLAAVLLGAGGARAAPNMPAPVSAPTGPPATSVTPSMTAPVATRAPPPDPSPPLPSPPLHRNAPTKPAAVAHSVARTPAPPAAPPASMKVSLEVPSLDVPWTLRVENTDTVPLRLVADARLLSLDVTPAVEQKHPHPLHCVLPDEMRPASDEERARVVPPKLTYVETFDPRLYCFGAREGAALVAGASVVPHLGWRPSRTGRIDPPFVVAPVEGVESRAAAKEIVGDPLTIPTATPTPTATSTPTPSVPSSGEPPPVLVQTPDRFDVARPRDLSIPVTITNESIRPITLLLRPETIGFDVIGPAGPTRCRPTTTPSPIIELFSTIAPHRRATAEVLVAELCPSGTFDRAGLYSVRPVLDTHRASGASLGLHTFDAEVPGGRTTLIRIRHPGERLPKR